MQSKPLVEKQTLLPAGAGIVGPGLTPAMSLHGSGASRAGYRMSMDGAYNMMRPLNEDVELADMGDSLGPPPGHISPHHALGMQGLNQESDLAGASIHTFSLVVTQEQSA